MLTFCDAQFITAEEVSIYSICTPAFLYISMWFLLRVYVPSLCNIFPQLIYFLLYTKLSFFVPHRLRVFNGLDQFWHHTGFHSQLLVMCKDLNCSHYFLNDKLARNTLVVGCGKTNFWPFHCRLSDILACATLKRLIFFSVLCILSLASLPYKYRGKVTLTINYCYCWCIYKGGLYQEKLCPWPWNGSQPMTLGRTLDLGKVFLDMDLPLANNIA